jgi:DNA-binding transcriptional LysR family regulator
MPEMTTLDNAQMLASACRQRMALDPRRRTGDAVLMELRQLRAFAETAEAGSITAAAKVLRVTQPALSRQIKALEEELGVVLFERGAHSVALTPAGEVLRSEAVKLLKFCDSMVQKVKSANASEPLRVGYSPSLAATFLSVAIERFTQLHPRVTITLHDWSSAEMRAGMEQGKLDLMVTVPCPGDAMRWVALRNVGWRVLLPVSHPLAKKTILTPEDLDGEKLLLFERESYPDYWNLITGFFKERNLQAKVAGEFDGIGSLCSAVEAGLGIALVAETSRIDRSADARLVMKSLSEEPTTTGVSVGISTRGEVPARVLAFVEELKVAAGS